MIHSWAKSQTWLWWETFWLTIQWIEMWLLYGQLELCIYLSFSSWEGGTTGCVLDFTAVICTVFRGSVWLGTVHVEVGMVYVDVGTGWIEVVSTVCVGAGAVHVEVIASCFDVVGSARWRIRSVSLLGSAGSSSNAISRFVPRGIGVEWNGGSLSCIKTPQCAGETIETYGCHCIVETELIQLGLVPKRLNFDHPSNLILGSLVVCISQPWPLRVVLSLYQQRHFCHNAEIIYSPKIILQAECKNTEVLVKFSVISTAELPFMFYY